MQRQTSFLGMFFMTTPVSKWVHVSESRKSRSTGSDLPTAVSSETKMAVWNPTKLGGWLLAAANKQTTHRLGTRAQKLKEKPIEDISIKEDWLREGTATMAGHRRNRPAPNCQAEIKLHLRWGDGILVGYSQYRHQYWAGTSFTPWILAPPGDGCDCGHQWESRSWAFPIVVPLCLCHVHCPDVASCNAFS